MGVEISRTKPGKRQCFVGQNVTDEPIEKSGVDYDDGQRKLSVSDTALSKLLQVIGEDLRWVVRSIGWGIAVVATCYGASLLL